MNDEFKCELLQRLTAIEARLDDLEIDHGNLKAAYARSRAHGRRLWLRPPMWTYEQHPPRPLNVGSPSRPTTLPQKIPAIAIVTPSFNHARFLRATIDSVIGRIIPICFITFRTAVRTTAASRP
jgi:hypothetical protein